jgi:hypothetical protein
MAASMRKKMPSRGVLAGAGCPAAASSAAGAPGPPSPHVNRGQFRGTGRRYRPPRYGTGRRDRTRSARRSCSQSAWPAVTMATSPDHVSTSPAWPGLAHCPPHRASSASCARAVPALDYHTPGAGAAGHSQGLPPGSARSRRSVQQVVGRDRGAGRSSVSDDAAAAGPGLHGSTVAPCSGPPGRRGRPAPGIYPARGRRSRRWRGDASRTSRSRPGPACCPASAAGADARAWRRPPSDTARLPGSAQSGQVAVPVLDRDRHPGELVAAHCDPRLALAGDPPPG